MSFPSAQVEQATLSSDHASTLARCNKSELCCAALEAESRVWLKGKEESVMRLEALRRDHERLTGLQQRQEAELEELLAKHSQLKSSNRSLEAQYKDVEVRYGYINYARKRMKSRRHEKPVIFCR